MHRPSYSSVAVLFIGIGVGSAGTFLLTSSKVEDLVASSYLRSASDARSFAQVLDDIKAHRETQAIARLEGNLAAALVSLGDYETVFPASRREPQVYEALATVRTYVASHPALTLPPEAVSTLAMGSTKDGR
jgi:hypothetical protein